MVFTASQATTFTSNAVAIQDALALQREVDLTERAIRNAGNRKQFAVLFNARIIGNPIGDPQDDNLLTALQIAYRDTFINGGYLVTLDADSGHWSLSWDAQDVEALVSVYSVRTTVIPGAIEQPTIDVIDSYFDSLAPVVKSATSLVNVSPGADTDENDFGAAISTFYEYISVVRQQDSTQDYSAGLRTSLTATTLGYSNTPSNVFVYKVA